ncbi:TonB-dependent receptor [Moheibacter lacus]|uniref:TonB-dependent receptor n=1 Tax=Moheibacter lacus TaxID=2745851 RepID=UPI00293C0C79|nr:TonB-dependent receptor [Moheibacter lacus]
MKTLLALICLIIGIISSAQTILDKESKQPIPDAEVTVGNASAITDENGNFSLDIKEEDEIIISAENYPVVKTSLKKFENGIYYLSAHFVELENIVITPNRWANQLSDSPNKVISISTQEIELPNPQTVADLLNEKTEVFVQKSQLGGGSPMIRGFSTNRVLISVDGVRMNNAIFRSGNLQNVIALDANALQSVEVMLGPGSLLYGSDAIGGVMGFYTLTPQFSTQDKFMANGSLMTRYSTANNEKTAHAHFNLAGRKFSSLTSFSFSDFDDLKMGTHGPEEYLRNHYVIRENGEDIQVDNEDPRKQVGSGYEQYNVMQKFRYKPNSSWDLNYGFHYSTTSDVPRYDRLIRYRNENLRSAEWYYGPQTWMMNHFSVEHKAEKGFYNDVKLNLAHQFFEESRHDRNFGNEERTDQTEKVNVYSANLDFLKFINSKNTLYYGIETLFNKVNSTGKITDIVDGNQEEFSSRYPDGATWNSYAAYISYEFKPIEKITIQGGLRYNYVSSLSKFNSQFYDFPFTEAKIETGALTGNIGLNYHPTKKTELRAVFSTGFRAPNIDDIGKIFDSEPGAVVIPNPDLEHEYVYNGEIGMSQKLGNFAKLDVSVFYTDLKNALVRRDFTLNGQDSIVYAGEMSRVQAIQNAAKAYAYGVEVSLEFYFTQKLMMKNSVNYQKGKEELDNGDEAPLRHIAPLLVKSGITYQTKKFRTELYMMYNGEISNADLAPSEQEKDYMYAIDENGNPYSPSWYTLNLKGIYDVNSSLSISAGWENMTNERYRPYSSGIVAAGSNLILAVRFDF